MHKERKWAGYWKKKLIKTASYIYAGYKICSLHFWSFVPFSWSFRGCCVFVIKPRRTRRENELEWWHLSTKRSARQGDATDRYVWSRVQYTFQHASIGNKQLPPKKNEKWKMTTRFRELLILCRLVYQGYTHFCQNNWRLFNPTVFKSNWTKQKLPRTV